jgi:hypothetical protein
MSFNPTFSLKYMLSNWAGNVPRYAVVALVGEYECGVDQVPSSFVSRGINAVPGEYHRFLLRDLISDGWIGRRNARLTATGISLMMSKVRWYNEALPSVDKERLRRERGARLPLPKKHTSADNIGEVSDHSVGVT